MIENAMKAVLKRIASPAWADDLWHQHAPLGLELDVLSTGIPEPLRETMLTALRQIKPRQKLAVLSMASNEAPYLPEFIAHCLAIGAEHIFMYTNDNTDGTDEVLRWFATYAPVTVIPVEVTPGVNVQAKNYEHALLLLPELRLYDWVLVVDVDEFLIPGAQYGHHLPTMLNAAPKETDVILFPWRWRLWDRSFERTPGLLAERFPHAGEHDCLKPLMRPRCVTSLRPVHVPLHVAGTVFRDTAFDVIPEERLWDKGSYKGGWIEHFWGRSFEEYEVKKRRAEGFGEAGRRYYEQFFEWSPRLTEANFLPVPEVVVARQKALLEKFSGKPGFSALMARVEAKWRDFAGNVRNDPELRQTYVEMLKRFPAK